LRAVCLQTDRFCGNVGSGWFDQEEGRMGKVARGVAVSTALLLVTALTAVPVAAAAVPPARLNARFEPGARLGRTSALSLSLRVAPRPIVTAPLARLRLEFPASLGVATSGLGIVPCVRPPSDFEAVLIDGLGLAGCSPNAVMGVGTARADIRIGTLTVPEEAGIAMLSGPTVGNRTGLVFYVTGWRPFGALIALQGRIDDAPAPFGGAIALEVPSIPNDFDADFALRRISFEIGGAELRYRERRGGRTVSYRPEGIGLPERCPAGGFRFRARLTFADGMRTTATETIRCPRPSQRSRP
jgi:hypothetical protein